MIRTITLSIGLILLSHHSLACRETIPLRAEDKNNAEVVFIGEPYAAVVISKDLGKGLVKSKISYKTIKTLKGKHQEKWTVYEPFNWFGDADNLDQLKLKYGPRQEIGISTSQTYSELPLIVSSGVCGTPYIIKANEN